MRMEYAPWIVAASASNWSVLNTSDPSIVSTYFLPRFDPPNNDVTVTGKVDVYVYIRVGGMHMRGGRHAHAAMYAPPSMRAHASFRRLLGCASTSLIHHQRRRTDCKIDHHTHARYAQRNCTTGGQTTLMANLMLTKYEKVGVVSDT
jgi:hypothetical protein